jgi:hypothetical protein
MSKINVKGAYFWAFWSRNEHRWDFPTPRHLQDERMGNFAVVQVEEVRRAVICFEHRRHWATTSVADPEDKASFRSSSLSMQPR